MENGTWPPKNPWDIGGNSDHVTLGLGLLLRLGGYPVTATILRNYGDTTVSLILDRGD